MSWRIFHAKLSWKWVLFVGNVPMGFSVFETPAYCFNRRMYRNIERGRTNERKKMICSEYVSVLGVHAMIWYYKCTGTSTHPHACCVAKNLHFWYRWWTFYFPLNLIFQIRLLFLLFSSLLLLSSHFFRLLLLILCLFVLLYVHLWLQSSHKYYSSPLCHFHLLFVALCFSWCCCVCLFVVFVFFHFVF